MDNRAIKFRAWDSANGLMLPSFDNWLDFDGNYWEPPDRTYGTPNQEIVKRQDVILMEYTGVNDRLGVPICESDVLRTPRNDWGVVVRRPITFEVTVSETQSSAYSQVWYESCEVIGNIYEDPELLKDENHEKKEQK